MEFWYNTSIKDPISQSYLSELDWQAVVDVLSSRTALNTLIVNLRDEAYHCQDVHDSVARDATTAEEGLAQLQNKGRVPVEVNIKSCCTFALVLFLLTTLRMLFVGELCPFASLERTYAPTPMETGSLTALFLHFMLAGNDGSYVRYSWLCSLQSNSSHIS